LAPSLQMAGAEAPKLLFPVLAPWLSLADLLGRASRQA
jgi:hypothetical protein